MDGEVLKVVLGEGLNQATIYIARDGTGSLITIRSVYDGDPKLHRFPNVHPERVRLGHLMEVVREHNERAKDGNSN